MKKSVTKTSGSLLVFTGFCLLALALAGHAVAQEYRIGPRDVLNLKIYAGGEKYQDIDLTVSANGQVNVPLIGNIQASGLTISQLQEKILEPLERDYYVAPQVLVVIKEYNSLHYYISGAVKEPGDYETTSPASILELIAKAGGALPQRGNVAYVLRGGALPPEEGEAPVVSADPVKVNLSQLLDRGDMSHNMILCPGDVVYIPFKNSLDPATSKVYVEGQVKNAGVYDYQPGLTALNACVMAGGFDKYAAPNRAYIIRGRGEDRKVIKVDLQKVQTGDIPDPVLDPGDRIHVPKSWF